MALGYNEPFAQREVADLIFYDFETNHPALWFPWANTVANELTGDAVYAYGGKGHPKRAGYNGEKGGTFKVETQMTTAQLYQMMTGATHSTSASKLVREVLTCQTAGKVTLTATPESGSLFVYAEDDDCGESIVGTLAAAVFTATTASDIAVNSKYVAYYSVAKSTGVHKLSIKSTSVPKAVKITAKTLYKTEQDELVDADMVVYKAQPNANLTWSFANAGDPATVTLTFDLMADGDNNLIDIVWED